MGKILCIETSTEVCSVAIVENGVVQDFQEDLTGQNHSKLLTVYIQELLQKNSLKVSNFDAIAVSKGPGSYTGLRIGASVAKGLCYAAKLPLIAICPLEAMANAVIEKLNADANLLSPTDRFMPMIDARRMEVYTGLWNNRGQETMLVHARVVDVSTIEAINSKGKTYYFGNGASKCAETLNSEEFVLVTDVITSAKNMARLAFEAFKKAEFEDIAYFEPHYLKEFMAIVGKNKVL